MPPNGAFDFVYCRSVDKGPMRHGSIQARTYSKPSHPFDQRLDEPIVNSFLHEYPIGAYTSLSKTPELAGQDALHCCVHIGVVKHDERRVAT